VALTKLKNMNGILTEGPVSNLRKTKGFNIEKKNEGFFKDFSETPKIYFIFNHKKKKA
jgi:hypothetical protein